MKKGFLLGALLLGAASVSMLTGFDSAATAEDVLQKYTQASKETTEANADATFELDAKIAIPAADVSFGITGSMDEDISFTLDPLALKGLMNMNVSAMGQELKASVDMYGVPDDNGQFALYIKTAMDGEEEEEWQKTTAEMAEIQDMLNKAMAADFDFSALPFAFELAPEPKEANGKECYDLTASVTWQDLMLMAEPYMDTITEEGGISREDLETYGQLLNGIQFNISLLISTEDYKPVYLSLDLDGSDWTMVSALIASSFGTDEDGNPYEVSLDVNTCSLGITYDYETPVEIVLPAEAAAAQSADPSSLLDMVEESVDDAA